MTKPSKRRERNQRSTQAARQSHSFVRSGAKAKTKREQEPNSSHREPPPPPPPCFPDLAHRIQLPTPAPAPRYAAIPRLLSPTRNLVPFAGEILLWTRPSLLLGRLGSCREGLVRRSLRPVMVLARLNPRPAGCSRLLQLSAENL
jgi:hypothetical protein